MIPRIKQICESANAGTYYFASRFDILHTELKINAGSGKKRKCPNG